MHMVQKFLAVALEYFCFAYPSYNVNGYGCKICQTSFLTLLENHGKGIMLHVMILMMIKVVCSLKDNVASNTFIIFRHFLFIYYTSKKFTF